VLFFWVALGGALGSIARLGLSQAVTRILGDGFPYGILVVNVVGSFVMGVASAFLMRKFQDAQALQFFVTTGFLGGFTTFSAFSLDVFKLVNNGQNGAALVYVAASVGLSLIAVFAGFAMLRGVV
jgi:fluoride exporter